MSKSLKKKSHWTSKVHESVIGRNPEGQLGFELKGGAENGQFPYLGEVKPGKVAYESGSKLVSEELLLEVNETPVAGLTIRDVLAVIKHCKDPLRLKCVKQGERGGRTAGGAGRREGGLAREGGVLPGGAVRSRLHRVSRGAWRRIRTGGRLGRRAGFGAAYNFVCAVPRRPWKVLGLVSDLGDAGELRGQIQCASVAAPAADGELSGEGGKGGRMEGREERK